MTGQYGLMALLAATDSWSDAWLGIEPSERFPLLIIAIGCGTAVVITLGCIAAVLFNSMHRRRVDEALKRDMLDRGMSADEIVRVIESEAPPEPGPTLSLACKNRK